MEVRPGYKQSEFGVIPEEWNVKRIGDVFNITAGGDFDSSRSSLIQDERYPFPIYSNSLSLRGLYGYSCYADHIAGSITVTARGSVGTANYRSHKFTAIGRVLVLAPYQTCDGQFFSEFINERISFAIESTGVPQLTAPQISDYKIPVPLLNEQRAIASALSDVDALLAKLDQLIVKKRDLKQATMQQLLTGQTRLPGFSGIWKVKPLGDVSPLQRGFDLLTTRLRDGCYPVVYSNGVSSYHDEFMVKGPGVVTGRSGTIGNVHFVDVNFWPHNTSLWVTNFKGNSPKFIFYLLGSLGLERFGSGSGVPTLNRNDVHAHRVQIPPTLDEQTAIATILSDMDAELAALEARRDKTRALKQGMMQALLTGKIRLLADSNGAGHDKVQAMTLDTAAEAP